MFAITSKDTRNLPTHNVGILLVDPHPASNGAADFTCQLMETCPHATGLQDPSRCHHNQMCRQILSQLQPLQEPKVGCASAYQALPPPAHRQLYNPAENLNCIP